MPRAFHSDAILYDHVDPEDRRSTLKFNLWKCDEPHDLFSNDQAICLDDTGTITLRLSDAEAITLYEQLRATWAGYVSEMRQAEHSVRNGWSVDRDGNLLLREGGRLAEYIDEWRAERENDMDAYLPTDPKSHGYHDRMVDVWDNREK